MKNEYKLPVDVYITVKQYVAGYERRRANLKRLELAGSELSAAEREDLFKNNVIDDAAAQIGSGIHNDELRRKLIAAIKENCRNKNASFGYFDLPGVSPYLFFREKHKFLYTIAQACHLIN